MRMHDERKGSGCPRLHPQMRALSDSQDQKVDRTFLDVLEDLLTCIARLDECSRIAKHFRLRRHRRIESAIKALSHLFQSVWMMDGFAFHYVEFIDLRSGRLCE